MALKYLHGPNDGTSRLSYLFCDHCDQPILDASTGTVLVGSGTAVQLAHQGSCQDALQAATRASGGDYTSITIPRLLHDLTQTLSYPGASDLRLERSTGTRQLVTRNPNGRVVCDPELVARQEAIASQKRAVAAEMRARHTAAAERGTDIEGPIGDLLALMASRPITSRNP